MIPSTYFDNSSVVTSSTAAVAELVVNSQTWFVAAVAD